MHKYLEKAKFYGKITGAVVAFVAAATVTFPYWTYDSYEVTVNNITEKSGLFVVGTDQGGFKVEDSWYYLQFDTDDTISLLREGGRYRIGTTGVRIPIPGNRIYENIISVEEIKQ